MYRYYNKQSGRLNLSASLLETIEPLKGGNGPIVMTLRSLPDLYGDDSYIMITENDGTILFHREGNYNYWSDLNDSSVSSRSKRITVEFQPSHNHGEFTDSYLEWKVAGGHDTDPDQFCDCC